MMRVVDLVRKFGPHGLHDVGRLVFTSTLLRSRVVGSSLAEHLQALRCSQPTQYSILLSPLQL